MKKYKNVVKFDDKFSNKLKKRNFFNLVNFSFSDFNLS